MLTEETLKSVIHSEGLSQAQQLLLCLAVEPAVPKKPAQIKSLAVAAGVRAARNWNVAGILGRGKKLSINTPAGWELSAPGMEAVRELAGPLFSGPLPTVAATLRTYLPKLSNPDTRVFVEEAISCLENNLLRAAVVLSWIGAVSILHDHVVTNHLAAFNTEATARNAKWKTAKTADDLAKMGESDFLDVLEKLSIIGKNVKTELKDCLDLRNGCGHPNTLQVGTKMVEAHLEVLILNVFDKF